MTTKVGICACYAHPNYGSMLQSLATIKAFEKEGLDCEFIRYVKKKTPLFLLKSIPRIFNRITQSDKYLVIQKKINLIRYPEAARENAARVKAFKRFQERYFTQLSPEYCGYPALKAAAGGYAGMISGSDQVWSPSALATHFYDLTFVPDAVPKISYASSFGIEKIPSYQVARTKRFLGRIPFISVRETTGQHIVQALTGKKVPVVCDPTLLFNAESWSELVPQKRLTDERYLFAYFLGAVPEYRETVKAFAQKSGLKISAIHHMDQYVAADEGFGDFVFSDAGPEEFLNLIRGADFICTDSFHGMIFSLIHHKQFVVFNRYQDGAKDSKNSRIDSLCGLLGLNERRFAGNLEEQLSAGIDYAAVDQRIEPLRRQSWEYIHHAILSVKNTKA